MAAKATSQPLDQGKAMNALLALLVADREERLAGDGAEPKKTEMVLASVGLTAIEIAPLVGKSTDAVTKTIQRARQPRSRARGQRSGRGWPRTGSFGVSSSRSGTSRRRG